LQSEANSRQLIHELDYVTLIDRKDRYHELQLTVGHR